MTQPDTLQPRLPPGGWLLLLACWLAARSYFNPSPRTPQRGDPPPKEDEYMTQTRAEVRREKRAAEKAAQYARTGFVDRSKYQPCHNQPVTDRATTTAIRPKNCTGARLTGKSEREW